MAPIGFTLSPGKNYIAQRFLTMNSEGWRPLKGGRFEKVGYLNTGLVYAGPNGSMRPPLRMAHSEMPWAGKFGEALSGSINKRRTLGMTFVHIPGGALNLFARVEQGGLGISCPPGIEPGCTWYQQSLAHHLRHELVERVNQTVTLGVDLNVLVGTTGEWDAGASKVLKHIACAVAARTREEADHMYGIFIQQLCVVVRCFRARAPPC